MKLRAADEAKCCHEAKNRMKMGAANEAENSRRSEEQLIKIGTANEATATVPVMKLNKQKEEHLTSLIQMLNIKTS
jgi:hypothetical protein